jgi:hypothetical protein
MRSINEFEFIAILIFSVTIVGCNKSNESKKTDLNTETQGYVFQMNEKYSGSENHDLTKIAISRIKIGDTDLYIKDDIGQKLEIGGRYGSISSRFIQFVSVFPNVSKPEFIIVTSNDAASCCPWINFHIITLRDGSPALFSIDSTSVEEIRAKRGKSAGYDFLISVKSGVDKAGDSVMEELELLDASNAILKKGLNDKFPGLGNIIYPADFFDDKKLRSRILDFKDEDFLDVRGFASGNQVLELPIKWIKNSALMMCSAIKGEWKNSQIMLIDLETKGYEIQKIIDAKLVSIKTGKEIIRKEIKNSISYSDGECFETQYQRVKTEFKRN